MSNMLGHKVKCVVTGFTGIATAKIEYLNGCLQYCVKPPSGKDRGKDEEGIYIDEGQLVYAHKNSKHILTGELAKGQVQDKQLAKRHKPPGGPQQDQPKSDKYSG